MTVTVTQGLEIHHWYTGELIDSITIFHDAEYSQSVNVSDVLRFTVPTDTTVSGLAIENEIWLRRGDANEVVRKFVIKEIEDIDGLQRQKRVVCYDFLCHLFDRVEEYPPDQPDETDVSILSYLNGLLILQSRITWGTLPPVGMNDTLKFKDIAITGESILTALQRVRDLIGGMLWVDNDKRLHWYTERFLTPHATYTLELGRNCNEIRIKDDRTDGPSTLSYDVDFLDLSQVSGEDDGLLNIGMPVYLDSVKLYITSIRQNLDNPLACQISVSTDIETQGRPRDLIDHLVRAAQNGTERARVEALHQTRIEQLTEDVAEIRADIGDMDLLEAEMAVDNLVDAILALEDEIAGIEPTYSTTAQSVGAANAAGTAETVSRGDHVHAGPQASTSTPAAVGATGAAGTATAWARGDHVHAGPQASTTTPAILAEVGAVGTGTTWARADHSHSHRLLYKAKVVSISGANIVCKLWSYTSEDWATSTNNVAKPWYLAKNSGTVTYTDGSEREFDTTDLEANYERRATWTEDSVEQTEVQAITPPYAVDEELIVMKFGTSEYLDLNIAGRTWAAIEEEEGT